MMKQTPSDTFKELLAEVIEIGRLYDDVVFIGGMAVYLHAINQEITRPYAEFTKDAVLYISLAGFSDLRDVEEVVQNTRLSKHEFRRKDFSFDVYAERQAKLAVPYDSVAAHAAAYEGIKVAALEELLVLKLEAAADRHASMHGRKDAKDVIRILVLGAKGKFDPRRAVAFMTQQHFERLEAIVRGPEFTAMAQGNVKTAKELRQLAQEVFERIAHAYEGGDKPPRKRKPG